jgi:hypothetical protein
MSFTRRRRRARRSRADPSNCGIGSHVEVKGLRQRLERTVPQRLGVGEQIPSQARPCVNNAVESKGTSRARSAKLWFRRKRATSSAFSLSIAKSYTTLGASIMQGIIKSWAIGLGTRS